MSQKQYLMGRPIMYMYACRHLAQKRKVYSIPKGWCVGVFWYYSMLKQPLTTNCFNNDYTPIEYHTRMCMYKKCMRQSCLKAIFKKLTIQLMDARVYAIAQRYWYGLMCMPKKLYTDIHLISCVATSCIFAIHVKCYFCSSHQIKKLLSLCVSLTL